MTIDLRYAQFGDFPRIRNFLDQHWQKDYVYVRQPELFGWTFGRADLWDQEGYSFALMEDKEQVVGILGAIPFVFNRLGESFARRLVCQLYGPSRISSRSPSDEASLGIPSAALQFRDSIWIEPASGANLSKARLAIVEAYSAPLCRLAGCNRKNERIDKDGVSGLRLASCRGPRRPIHL